MCVLFDRVQCNQVLYMGSCMGAMMAGAGFFFDGRYHGDNGTELFDFMLGTSLKYQPGTAVLDCTTNTISAQTITITGGSGVAVRVWADKRDVKQFPTTKKHKWNDWSSQT